MINTRQHQPSDDRKTTINHPMVAAWYGSNIGVLLLNKYLLTNYGFKFPIFLTLRHMAACIVLSYAAIVLMEVVPLQRVKSKVQLAKISGLSVVFCFCVVCGNVSLKYLPVSFNESVGATPPPPSLPPFSHFRSSRRGRLLLTYTALIPVVAGVIIASGGEPSFHIFGFIMCITATAARAFKSVLQEILLSSEGENLDSMNLLHR
ncbi:hypothetical protein ACFX13_033582 [Malus domestica]